MTPKSLKFITLCITLLIWSQKVDAQERGLSVNLPLALTGSFNIELSQMVRGRVSLHLPISWSPWQFKEDRKLKHLTTMFGARWWQWHCNSGLFFANYLSFNWFNITYKDGRYYGKGFGDIISIGYAKMLSTKWNIELEGGLFGGMLYYDKYERCRCGEFLESVKRGSLLPSKLSLTIVYLF